MIFAFDVPKGLVHTSHGAHHDGTTPIEARPVHHLPVVLNPQWVLSDEIRGELLHGGLYSVCVALYHGLTPAGNALVRIDFQEQPSRLHGVECQFCDFHDGTPFSALRGQWRRRLSRPVPRPQ